MRKHDNVLVTDEDVPRSIYALRGVVVRYRVFKPYRVKNIACSRLGCSDFDAPYQPAKEPHYP